MTTNPNRRHDWHTYGIILVVALGVAAFFIAAELSTR